MSFAEKISTWSDDKCLEAATALLERLELDTRFAMDEDGLITHQMLLIGCGDKVIVSDPKPLDWPLQRLPVPKTLEDLWRDADGG